MPYVASVMRRKAVIWVPSVNGRELQDVIRRGRQWLYLRILPRLPGRVERAIQNVLANVVLRGLRMRLGVAAVRRVLLVTNDLSRSGAPQLVYQMALLQKQAGACPIVLSPLSGAMLADFEQAGIPVIVKPRPSVWEHVIPRMLPFLDAAICNTVDTADAVRLLAPKVPTLWYLHEISLIEERRASPNVRDAMTLAQRVWAGSPPCAEVIRELRSDVEVVAYGLTPLPRSRRADGGRFRIGVFGSIERRKGQDLVVEALSLLSQEVSDGVEIAFFGRSLDVDLGQRLAMAAAENPSISFHQELDRAGYIEAMGNVDAVLVSSRDDTLPLVSLDALGMGRMLLLAPTVGTKAWLEDGVDCLVGRATTAHGIADLIARGWAVRDERERFARAAQAAFQAHFSLDRFKVRLDGVVKEMAGS